MSAPNLQAGLKVIMAVSETIRELKEVPSGALYANLMGQLTFEQYSQVIGILKRSGVIEEKGHVLKWIFVEGAPPCAK